VLENSKVIWKEGLFLQPQHFQQLERMVLGRMDMRFSSCFPYDYGLTDFAVNSEAIANGLFTISRAAGVMPDGAVFDTRLHAAPTARPFADFFSHEQQTLNVYLGIPLNLDGRPNVAAAAAESGAGAQARYIRRPTSVHDEVTGGQRKEIELGEPNFQVVFEGESLDNFSSMQIARLVRRADGAVNLDQAYLPPMLYTGVSRSLTEQLRSLLEVLLAKNASLSQGRKQHAGGFAEFKASEETPFRLLQTINTYTPLISHYHVSGTVHPYQLFLTLSEMAGALCTFSNEVTIRQLPRYDHNRLEDAFAVLIRIIRTVLNADIAAGSVPVPIEQTGPATYVCAVGDQKLFDSARFFLGVSAAVPEKELVVGALQRIKMCSRDRLELLIPSAMPGLTLRHAARPPEELSTKPGFIYFSIDQRGEFWEGIKTSGNIAFYFPNNYPKLSLEMLALKQ
jgi:type VI secretion system protein ImpJ